jgi:hypothetical protein
MSAAAVSRRDAPTDRREARLDEALQLTFPASDPIALSVDEPDPARVPDAHTSSGGRFVRPTPGAKTRRNPAKRSHHGAGTWTWPRSPKK